MRFSRCGHPRRRLRRVLWATSTFVPCLTRPLPPSSDHPYLMVRSFRGWAHLRYVCAPLGESVRPTGPGAGLAHPQLEAVIAVLSNAPVTHRRLGNISPFPDFDRLVRYESHRSEFGRIGFASYLVLLRLQSESMPMCRAYRNVPLLPQNPAARKSVLCLIFGPRVGTAGN